MWNGFDFAPLFGDVRIHSDWHCWDVRVFATPVSVVTKKPDVRLAKHFTSDIFSVFSAFLIGTGNRSIVFPLEGLSFCCASFDARWLNIWKAALIWFVSHFLNLEQVLGPAHSWNSIRMAYLDIQEIASQVFFLNLRLWSFVAQFAWEVPLLSTDVMLSNNGDGLARSSGRDWCDLNPDEPRQRKVCEASRKDFIRANRDESCSGTSLNRNSLLDRTFDWNESFLPELSMTERN